MDDSLELEAQRARASIASGALRGQALLARILAVPPLDRDVWVDELLGIGDEPPDIPDLPRGSVPYLPCGVEEILAAASEAPIRPTDVLVDLGSGLGRVVLLAHLLTGARAHGVEIQEPLVHRAQSLATELALPAVSFIQGDAASSDSTDLEGTVFFLYAPFNGDTLTRVLRRLEIIAQRAPIVVCAVGLELRDVPWLAPRASSCVSLIFYDSIPRAHD